MAVSFLRDEELGYSCLYCNTSMTVFGDIFYDPEDPDEFCDWLGLDPRLLDQNELSKKVSEWRREKDEQNEVE
tara:strand:- start:3134 stop:3352 length:219 start_codon:yes stop_codon:yes gene_type:complete